MKILNFISNKTIKLFKFLLRYIKIKDILILFSFLLVSNFAYIVLTYLYPTTGEPSFQWLYNLLWGITRGVAIIGAAYLILSLLIPYVFFYLEDVLFQKDIKNITEWQKIRFFTFLYCFFILVVTISVITM